MRSPASSQEKLLVSTAKTNKNLISSTRQKQVGKSNFIGKALISRFHKGSMRLCLVYEYCGQSFLLFPNTSSLPTHTNTKPNQLIRIMVSSRSRTDTHTLKYGNLPWQHVNKALEFTGAENVIYIYTPVMFLLKNIDWVNTRLTCWMLIIITDQTEVCKK